VAISDNNNISLPSIGIDSLEGAVAELLVLCEKLAGESLGKSWQKSMAFHMAHLQ
jgi:hypothetical protein